MNAFEELMEASLPLRVALIDAGGTVLVTLEVGELTSGALHGFIEAVSAAERPALRKLIDASLELDEEEE